MPPSVNQVNVEERFLEQWQEETTHICAIQTYRNVDLSHEQVNKNLMEIRDYLNVKADECNDGLSLLQLTPFQWCRFENETTTVEPSDEDCVACKYWVFGFRFGSPDPKQKLTIICHLDTVPASNSSDGSWTPFDVKVKSNDYDGGAGSESPQDFLVGRGCIDDKGPAISAFLVVRALAMAFDGSPKMEDTQIEIIFDTSEETDMSTPYYLLDEKNTKVPDFGVVYDAQWCVRAEKGCERPVFTVEATSAPAADSLYISTLQTAPDNSTNTIPDWAEAVITGDRSLVKEFADTVETDYIEAEFDDKKYRKAILVVTETEESVTLRTLVKGAQHGSAPEENRLNGANPLVSLGNFLAGLSGDGYNGTLAINAPASMCEFIKWSWGTHVFGEDHDSLERCDDVFMEGNGTTYAVTKVSMGAEQEPVKLEVDIRYAIAHHEGGCDWKGDTEGLLPGNLSVFKGVFGDLVKEFNDDDSHSKYANVEEPVTSTIFGPDIRLPDENEDYMAVEEAFKDVMGYRPEPYAIGGGTDAKGHTFLLAVGPLMAKELGPPINYHGIDEGAPMADFCKSTEILFTLFSKLILSPPKRKKELAHKALKRVQELRETGHKFCCSC